MMHRLVTWNPTFLASFRTICMLCSQVIIYLVFTQHEYLYE